MRKFVVVSMVALFALFISIPMANAQIGSLIGCVVSVPAVGIPINSPIPDNPSGVSCDASGTLKRIKKPPLMGTLTAITPPEPVIGEAWQDMDGDGVDDFNEDNCLDYKNPDQEDEDGDGVGDVCDVCLGDPNPYHQELDDCAVDEDETEIGDVEVYDSGDEELVEVEEDGLDVESGGMNYFDLTEEEFDDSMAANAEAGAGCSLAQTSPAINALGIFLIGIGLLQIISRKRK